MSKNYLLLFLLIFSCKISDLHAQRLNKNDLRQLVGEWKGTLTYLDYTTKKDFTMPADLKIIQSANTNQLVFANIYPNEPRANNFDTVMISHNRKKIGKEVLKLKTRLPNGNTRIVTEYLSVDGNDNKPALIRHTYTYGESAFVKRKEVKFKGEMEWVKRHEYSFRRG